MHIIKINKLFLLLDTDKYTWRYFKRIFFIYLENNQINLKGVLIYND